MAVTTGVSAPDSLICPTGRLTGLPDTRKFYQWCATRQELLRDLFATPLQAPPGTQVTYSDLGFLALGEIVAAVTSEPLDTAVRSLVTGPLGMPSTEYAPAASPDRFAATERVTR